jgi:hypothetical protein
MTPPLQWKKSSRTDSANCVELALPPATFAIRDSKNPSPTLHFPHPHLATFLTTLKAATLDPTGP